jgi:uncharacterized protein (TIGR00661 family)
LKVLYAIQGTGNGHLTRARDLVPLLLEKSETDVLVSGIQSDISLGIPETFRRKGMSFIFGKGGGVDFVATFRKCLTRKFISEVRDFPIEDYDLVINDFEPVSAWAARIKGVPCISLSHQYAVLHYNSPRPEKQDWMGKMVLANYAPVQKGFGFHFQSYAPNIFTPVIRNEVRNLKIRNKGHITVYLPAYDNERIIKVLSQFKDVSWDVFSKHSQQRFREGNIQFRPVENREFLQSMADSEGVLCGAGFETPAEALFMGKKLMVIPMKNQYEQQCNAAALHGMGIKTMKSLKKKNAWQIEDWLYRGVSMKISYPDQSSHVLDKIMMEAQLLPKPKPVPVFSLL